MSIKWADATILVTGGTGSFGKKFIELLINEKKPKKIIVFSRDELKQFDMQGSPEFDYPGMRYFLGDVRDRDRLNRALRGVDIVVHAAALKQIGACEYNPHEAVKTNIDAIMNLVDASINCGVKKVVGLTTDKAAAPITFYGATKMVGEHLLTSGMAYAGNTPTTFAAVRYGNVAASRGSIIPFFKKVAVERKVIPITDPLMTRFWVTREEAARFVLNALEHMIGGEIFIPRLPSFRVTDLAKAIAPSVPQKTIGIRGREKLHEDLIIPEEAADTIEFPNHFVITGTYSRKAPMYAAMAKMPRSFAYDSGSNPHFLSVAELERLVQAPL